MKSLQFREKHTVVKQHTLNDLRPTKMSLQELRFLILYLSKINPKDITTRNARFSLSDFRNIMEIGRIDIKKVREVIDGLLTKVTGEALPSGGFVRFQFFKECILDKDEMGEWFIEIDVHDRALPLVFDLKNRYVTYELWNALRLKSKNQLRMYEVLKQYEKIGSRIVNLDTLKSLLGINEGEYSRFNDFKNDVLEVCKKALKENTDIIFTYEPHGKRGKGGKILEIKFTITKNSNFKNPLQLTGFFENDSKEEKQTIYTESFVYDADLEDEENEIKSTDKHPLYEEHIAHLITACEGEFSRNQMIVLYNEMRDTVPYIANDKLKSHDYLQKKYNEMKMRDPVTSRFGYLRKIITLDGIENPSE